MPKKGKMQQVVVLQSLCFSRLICEVQGADAQCISLVSQLGAWPLRRPIQTRSAFQKVKNFPGLDHTINVFICFICGCYL